jgi:NADH-quinone oxidoreductase subunit A
MVLLTEGFGLLLLGCIGSLALGLIILLTAFIVSPKAPTALKNTPYESGMPVIGDAKIQFDVKFYLFTLLFILFDIEAMFLFPWAVSFEKLGVLGIVEMLVFMVILFAGLIYAWRREALEWQ